MTMRADKDPIFGPCGIDDLVVGSDTYRTALYHQSQQATLGAAQSIDLTKNSASAANPQYLDGGGFSIAIQARGGIAYVRMRPVGTNAATTALTGFAIADGAPAYKFDVSAEQRFLDVFGSAGTVVWWRCSPPRGA